MANLFETWRQKRMLNGIRVKPNPGKTPDSDIDPDSELAQILGADSLTQQQMLSIAAFRELSHNRSEQYDVFDEMEKDATISAALKMYADDATQYNLDGDVIWVESADPNIAKFGNRLLDKLGIQRNAWTHIYNLVKYGDLYLETFYDDEEFGMKSKVVDGATNVLQHKAGARIEEYVEMVDDAASIFDLRKKGKVAGFIRLDGQNPQQTNYTRAFSTNLTGTAQQILPSDKFIHISLGEASTRFPETFEIEYANESGDIVINSFKVSKGKSMLEDAFKSFRELKLMEDSILLNRVTRSSITRILQIEVGDMPKGQVREKLRQIKQMIEQRSFLDKDKGEFNNMAAPGPVDNVIYVPTRNGNGAITSTTLGGDVDPKSLADIEYYKQKLAGGLGIPLAFLESTSGDGGGLSSGTALTKLDNRYARSVKRIQMAYISGITTLLNIFAIRKGLTSYVNSFSVRMLSPSTIEDADRDEQLDNRVRIMNDLLSIITSQEEAYPKDVIKQITEYLMSTFLNKPEITEILQSSEDTGAEDEGAESSNEGETDFNFEGGGMAGDSDFGSDFNSDDFGEESFDTALDEEGSFEEIEDAINDAADIPEEPSEFGDFEEFA